MIYTPWNLVKYLYCDHCFERHHSLTFAPSFNLQICFTPKTLLTNHSFKRLPRTCTAFWYLWASAWIHKTILRLIHHQMWCHINSCCALWRHRPWTYFKWNILKKNGCIKGPLSCLLAFDKTTLAIYFGLILSFIGCRGGGFSIKMMEFAQVYFLILK